MRHKPSLNRHIRFTAFYVFDRVQLRLTPFLENSAQGLFLLDYRFLHHLFLLKICKLVWMRLKLDLHDCRSQNIAITLRLVMALILIGFCYLFFTHRVITHVLSIVPLHCIFYHLIYGRLYWRCYKSKSICASFHQQFSLGNPRYVFKW